jgi:hypothetical protein
VKYRVVCHFDVDVKTPGGFGMPDSDEPPTAFQVTSRVSDLLQPVSGVELLKLFVSPSNGGSEPTCGTGRLPGMEDY